MNKEMLQIAAAMEDGYEGDPWFGRSIKALLHEVTAAAAVEKPGGQHSILELVWHMVNWKTFALNRLLNATDKDVQYFEENDWAILNHDDTGLWPQGIAALHNTHTALVSAVRQQKDAMLDQVVTERTYTYRKLLHGALQHDIYHAGQIAYIQKFLKKI